MVRKFFFFQFMLLAFCANAQQNLPGFIINNQSDTIKGSLSAKKLSVYECQFTAAGQSNEQFYAPSDIAAFGTDNGRYFASYKIREGESNATVFAEVLVTGKMNLLKYKERYFLADGSEPIELAQVRSIVNKDGREVEQISYRYLQTLTWKFQDCPQAVEKVKTVTLEDRSLIKAFETYNSCFGEATGKKLTKQAARKPDVFVGIEVGFISAQINNYRDDYEIFLGSKVTSTSIFPGAFFQLRPSNKHISFNVGLQVTRYVFDSQKTYHQGVDINDHVKVSYSAVKIPISIGRDFGNGNIRPFVRLGGVLSAYMGKKTERKKEYATAVFPIVHTDPAFNFVAHPIAGLFDAGVQFQRGKLLGTLKGRLEFGPAPFKENVSKEGQRNISQKNYSAILSIGYKIGD